MTIPKHLQDAVDEGLRMVLYLWFSNETIHESGMLVLECLMDNYGSFTLDMSA